MMSGSLCTYVSLCACEFQLDGFVCILLRRFFGVRDCAHVGGRRAESSGFVVGVDVTVDIAVPDSELEIGVSTPSLSQAKMTIGQTIQGCRERTGELTCMPAIRIDPLFLLRVERPCE